MRTLMLMVFCCLTTGLPALAGLTNRLYAVVENNTIIGASIAGIKADVSEGLGGVAGYIVTNKNNIVLQTTDSDYAYTAGGDLSTTNHSYCLSSDATAGLFGGSGNVTGAVWSTVVTASNNATLLATSAAIDAGATIGTFSSDAIHGAGWRPKRGAWDMGAMELTGAPTLNNDGGASNVTTTTAVLNGVLVSYYGSTLATVYYGTSNGGTNKGSWDTSSSLGASVTGGLLKAVGSLTLLTPYYYNYYATNADGEGWASPSSEFTTADIYRFIRVGNGYMTFGNKHIRIE